MVNKIIQNKDNILLNIKRLRPNLNPALKRVATYILKNPVKMKLLKIKVLAKECKVSESTITRFVKEINLRSFQELKIALAELSSIDIKDVASKKNIVFDNISKKDTTQRIIDKIAFRNMEALQETMKFISPSEIEKAALAIKEANILIFYCVGWSTIAAENAKTRFYRVGKQSIIYNDPAQQLISGSLFDRNNVAIGISHTGATLPTVNAMKLAKKSGATTICITNFKTSPIVKYSDIKLFTSTTDLPLFEESVVPEESLVPIICQIFVVDILYTCFAVNQFDKSKEMLRKSIKDYKKGIKSVFSDV